MSETEQEPVAPGEHVRIGFIGVGNMGGNMAANLLAAGHELTVTDIRKEIAEPLLANGATWADTAKEVAAASDVIMLSLPMPADVEKVVTADDGVLAGAARGSTIIDLSTNSPSVVRALAVTTAAQGVGFLDAPVSGGIYGARKGTLAVMVGGDADLFEQHRPLFDVIGGNVFHVGDVGAGNVAKLINNMLSFVCMLGTTEALVLGAKAGIDPVVLREVVKAGSGNSFMWDRGGRAILKDRLAPSFTVTLAVKDVTLATALAEEFGVDVPMGRLSEELLTAYRDGGFASEDLLATVKGVEEQAGTVVRGRGPDL
jgi:3-hydroxyisobutyrate dehydrogenase